MVNFPFANTCSLFGGFDNLAFNSVEFSFSEADTKSQHDD